MGVTRIVKLPDIGEGVAEAEVVAWHVRPGDMVREDQTLAEVMTDKATVEIPSPVAGIVTALAADVGAMVAVGGELLRLEVAGGPAAPSPEDSRSKPRVAATADMAPQAPSPASPQAAPDPPRASAVALAAPAVRRRAHSLGIDLYALRGTGPEGRVLHADLDTLLRNGRAGEAAAAAAASEASTEIPVIGLRRRTAERMAEASRRVAHFSYVEEVDVTALEALRATLNAGPEAATGRLSPLPFLMLALVRAVADFPQMNAHYDDEAQVIRRYAAVHLGIATQTPSGLMVPVVRHAETRELRACAAELVRLVDAAREGKAKREELSGSTITLTSLGALGGLVSTPLVNLPEVAIIGVNRMAVRPVWAEGSFQPRMMMNLSCSFDHRVIDGHEAASFVRRIKELIEMPALLWLPPG